MDKVSFGIDIFMGVTAFVALIYIKAMEFKLGEKVNIIRSKKNLGSKFIYVIGIYLIVSKTGNLIGYIYENNFNIFLIIKCLSGIFVAAILVYLFSGKLRIMEDGMIYKDKILKNKEVIDIKNLSEGLIEITYTQDSSVKAWQITPQKQNCEEVIRILKTHLNI